MQPFVIQMWNDILDGARNVVGGIDATQARVRLRRRLIVLFARRIGFRCKYDCAIPHYLYNPLCDELEQALKLTTEWQRKDYGSEIAELLAAHKAIMGIYEKVDKQLRTLLAAENPKPEADTTDSKHNSKAHDP